MTPFVLHDLMDEDFFALAQAAGRAGFVVDGTSEEEAPWLHASRYLRRVVRMPSLAHTTRSMYAWHLKQSGLGGVWLACSEAVLGFTASYRGFLEKAGMRFLAPDAEVYERIVRRDYPDAPGLAKPFAAQLRVEALLGEEGKRLAYPIVVKPARGLCYRVEDHAGLRALLQEVGADKRPEGALYVQRYVPGEDARVAVAVVLCDAASRPVRVFTARRLRAFHGPMGRLGGMVAARAEWIGELAEAACALAEAAAWRGFLEVEAKQGPDGAWHLIEVHPRVSAWTVLAEADGAGLLRAYYALCTEGTRLSWASLQRNQAEYARALALRRPPAWRGRSELVAMLARALRTPDRFCIGAWDAHDLRASSLLAWRAWRAPRRKKG